jgi:hypothetical protein
VPESLIKISIFTIQPEKRSFTEGKNTMVVNKANPAPNRTIVSAICRDRKHPEASRMER